MTNNDTKKVRDPLFHITKRASIVWWKTILVRIIAVFAALIVVAVITLLITGQNPLEMYLVMFKGAFGTPRKFWTLIQETSLLLLVGLALTLSFKMRFWNIGGQGQVLAGAIIATACLKFLPWYKYQGNSFTDILMTVLLYLIMFLAALTAGGIWALIPGIFKAFLNTNETLFTLMMNYIALSIVAFLTHVWTKGAGSDRIGVLNEDLAHAGLIPSIGNSSFAGKDKIVNVLIVFIVLIVVFIYLKFSKQGYEISVVGESEKTAKYIGINVKKVIIRTVLISGAICGLAGLLLVSGVHHTLTTGIEDGRGFTAIIVSWMSHFNPLYMVISSFLIVFLQVGAEEISSSTALSLDYAKIVTGIIILFIIGCEFFINYKIVFRKKKGGESK